jgi:centrosomal CEP192-like protein
MFTKEVGRPMVCQTSKNKIFAGENCLRSPLHFLEFILFSFLLGVCGCGGVNLKTSNTLVASPSLITFGTVALGKNATASVSLQNRGIAPVAISQLNFNEQSYSVSGTGTLPATVAPGASYNLTIQFNPSSVGAANGQLVVGTGTTSLGATKIALSGSGVPGLSALSCSMSTVFGSATDSCTITLNAATGTDGLSIGLASTNTAVVLPTTVTVPANSTSASFTAKVSPVISPQSATLTASEGGSSSSFAVQLGPNGPFLSLNSTGISFGTTALNMPVTQDVVLTSAGNQPVSVTSAVLAGAGFTIPAAVFPLTLNPGQTATLHVQFKPQTLGAATGKLAINSNSMGDTTAAIVLSGIAVKYEVQLNWSAPSSDSVTGYKVYRSTGGTSNYQLLSSSVVSDTTYTDTSVQSGDAYDYVVESVDASGKQSGPSNSTTVAIP